MNGFSFVVYPREGEPTLIVPDVELEEAQQESWVENIRQFAWAHLDVPDPYQQIAKIMASLSLEDQTVGWEASFESVAPPLNAGEPAVPTERTRMLLKEALPNTRIIDATSSIHSCRACKTPAEIERLRLVNEIAAFGLAQFAESVDVGRTGHELAAEVEFAIVSQGVGYHGDRRVRAFAQVSTGTDETARAWRPMVTNTQRRLEQGDLAVLELGVVVDGYWADNTRVRVAGEPTNQQRDLHAAVLEAQQVAINVCHVGETCHEVDKAARTVLERRGLGEFFCTITGHGIGWRYHEPVPLLMPHNDAPLQTGMVHSVEPGIYSEEIGGIRIEDIVAETEDGPVRLSNFDQGLGEKK